MLYDAVVLSHLKNNNTQVISCYCCHSLYLLFVGCFFFFFGGGGGVHVCKRAYFSFSLGIITSYISF